MSFWTSSTAQCPDPEKAAHGSCNPRYETLRKTANTDPLYLQVFTIPPESGRNITKFCVPSAWLFFILFFFGQNLAVSPLLPGKPVSPPHAPKPKPGPKPQHLQRPVSPVKAPSKPPATLAMAKTPAKTPAKTAKTAPEKGQKRLCGGYGSIPINSIFRGMNIHLPAILMFTIDVLFPLVGRLIEGLVYPFNEF